MQKLYRKVIFLLCIIFVLFTTVVFSALSTSLAITTDVVIRPISDIRVDSVVLSGSTVDGATLQYESEFNMDRITNGFILPNANSSITYKVTISNNGDYDQTIYNMTTNSNINCNYVIKYSNGNTFNYKDIIEKKTSVDLYITYTPITPSNSVINITHNFDFRKVYKIVYQEQGGTSVTDQYKYEKEDLILNSINNVIEKPTKSGYNFLGWTDIENSNVVKFHAGDTLTIDLDENPIYTLYAIYELSEYNITFNPDNGENNIVRTISAGESLGTLPDVSKTGYTLDGWYDTSDNQITSSTIPTKDETYKAKWVANTYTITLDKNGGTNNPTNSITATYDSSDLEPARIILPEKLYTVSNFGLSSTRNSDGATVSSTSDLTTNYSFSGWYTESSNGIQLMDNQETPTLLSSINDYTDAESKWIHDEDITLFARYTGNGNITLPTIEKTGYTCGWTANENGTIIQHASGATISNVIASTPMYGVCEKIIYRATYNANGGTFGDSSSNIVEYDVDSESTITTVTKYSHTSNVDDTGKKNSDYGNSWTNANITGTDRGSTSEAHVVTIPGASTLNVEVYYNGESTSYDWVSIWSGSHPTYTAASNYSDSSAVAQKLGGSQSGSYTVNGNSLTSMGKSTYTITGDTVTFGFKSDGSLVGNGYGYYAIVTGTVGSNTENYKVPTRTDYIFNGWNTSSDSTGTVYTFEQDIIDYVNSNSQNLELYAMWNYVEQPTITKVDYNTFSYSAAAGSSYKITTSNTEPAASDSGWTTSTSYDVTSAGTYYVWVKDSAGNVSSNNRSITAYTVSRSASNATLTTRLDSTSSSTGTVFSSNTIMLRGTNVYASCTAGTGYQSPTLKHGSTSMTASGAYYAVGSSETISCSGSAKTYAITLNKGASTNTPTSSVTATYNSSSLSPSSITVPVQSYSVSGFGLSSTRKSDGATVSSTSALNATYTFDGWYSASTGGSKVLSNASNPVLQANVSGYTGANGIWTKDGTATLYARFTGNGSVTLPTIEKTGYTCGWTANEDGTTIQHASGATISNAITNTTLYGVCEDTQAPTLNLDKVTYKTNDFSDWTLSSNSSLDSNGVLTIGTDGNSATVSSDFIDVNGEFYYMTFDGYTEAAKPNSSLGGFSWTTRYYNSSFESTPSLENYNYNGHAKSVSLSEWHNNILWTDIATWESYKRYGPNVKYIKIVFTTGDNYSSSPVKIRNLKVYGQMINSFYLINVASSDNVGVTEKKYAKGTQSASYFASNGTSFTGDQISVTENGVYTVYIKDAAGNETVQTIEITNVVKTYTVTLDNQNATTSGTTEIYEKYDTGYYLNSSATTQMTTSLNGITVPTRTGYVFGGYYTGTNGSGTQYIDSSGKLTSNASTTNFTSNGTLYAYWEETSLTLKVGDYVEMAPTLSTYTTDTNMTGYSSTQTINPQELNLWRVIRVNGDGTYDAVSDKVSSVDVYFEGTKVYQNFVGYLNILASKYENSKYTVGSRYMGYNGQTEFISDTSYFDGTSTKAGTEWTSSTSGTPTEEYLGRGDSLYTTDTNLVKAVYSNSLVAQKVGTTTATAYWLGSRYYYYNGSADLGFSGRIISTGGSIIGSGRLRYYVSGWGNNSFAFALRPIITLRSSLQATGSGTSGDPYVLE